MAANVSSKIWLIARRLYSATTQKATPLPEVAALTKNIARKGAVEGEKYGVIRATESGRTTKEEICWWRDTKTGYWMPKSHCNPDGPDPVTLRQTLFANKTNPLPT